MELRGRRFLRIAPPRPIEKPTVVQQPYLSVVFVVECAH